MRLKTKLVLAITGLVFLIACVLSLVYVSHLVDAAVQQSDDSNLMVADLVRSTLQNTLLEELKDQTIDPNDKDKLRSLVQEAIKGSASLSATLDSTNMYSTTEYDVNIVDTKSRILLSTFPDNDGKLLPWRPKYSDLLAADPITKMREIYGPAKVFDIVAPLDRNSQPFLSVHVGVRTTLLQAVYEPSLKEAFELMAFALGTALVVAFLLSNLALRPLEEISIQLDYWNPLPAGIQSEKGEAPQLDTAERVSTKIEQIGQRMRNVEEVFSALKENLDQVLGNLQDGILLFTEMGGRCLCLKQRSASFMWKVTTSLVCRLAKSSTVPRCWDERFARPSMPESRWCRKKSRQKQDAAYKRQWILSTMTTRGMGLGALVTLHDLESVEQIESELELSRRMSAIGRLTAGVGMKSRSDQRHRRAS